MTQRKSFSIGFAVCLMTLVAIALCLSQSAFASQPLCEKNNRPFTTEFRLDDCTLSSTGSNTFFVLEPGFQTVFAGKEDRKSVELTITVLNETKLVDGVETRVIEERELHDGELVELSRNYFAICTETNSVFYFGEDVDIYEGGVIVSHDGSWLAGTNGAEPGVVMPGIILLGSRYYQELAAPVALDRAEIIKMDATVETPAGTFEDCLVTRETTPLEPKAKEFKFYAPGIGLVKDGVLLLENVSFP